MASWHRGPTICSTDPVEAVHRGPPLAEHPQQRSPAAPPAGRLQCATIGQGTTFLEADPAPTLPTPHPQGGPHPTFSIHPPVFFGFSCGGGRLELLAAGAIGCFKAWFLPPRRKLLVGLPPSLRSVAIRGVCLRPLCVGFCYP